MANFPMSEWMTHIASKTPINKLSIPGTHDSLTFKFVYENNTNILDSEKKRCARTQKADLMTQLNYGCRYLDIRIINDNLQGRHGDNAFGLDCEYNLYKVMDVVKEFLSKQPRETVIMRIKNERGNVEKSKIVTLINKYKSILWKRGTNTNTEAGNCWPLLKDVRGKIVVLDDLNDYPFHNHADMYGVNYPRVSGGKVTNSPAVYYVPQDDYSAPNEDKKLKEIKDNIDYNKDSLKLKINHVSATGTAAGALLLGWTPEDYADYLNPKVVDYLNKKGKCITGLLIFDFITANIAKAVIDKNTF